MKKEQALREQVVNLLKGEGAHAGFETAVKNIPASHQSKRPPGLPHSPWELLEHLRIAQWDILEFTRHAKHVSPDWPSGYWPAAAAPPDAAAWDKSVAAFHRDQAAMRELVEDHRTELYA